MPDGARTAVGARRAAVIASSCLLLVSCLVYVIVDPRRVANSSNDQFEIPSSDLEPNYASFEEARGRDGAASPVFLLGTSSPNISWLATVRQIATGSTRSEHLILLLLILINICISTLVLILISLSAASNLPLAPQRTRSQSAARPNAQE